MSNGRRLVRCEKNPYKTPLFSFDSAGIWIRCKDCRSVDSEGKMKRGVFHLTPWSLLMRYMLGLEDPPNVDTGGNSSSYHLAHEEPAPVGERSAGGDTGGQLDGSGFRLPVLQGSVGKPEPSDERGVPA